MIDLRELSRTCVVPARLPGRGARRVILLAAAMTSMASLAACGDGADDRNGGLEDGRAANGPAPATQTDAPAAARTADGSGPATAVVSFTPSAPAVEGEGAQGRLPAEGDLTIYIAATELFPGTARIAPAIENPYAGDEQAIAAGERHFAAFNCAGCHAPLGGGGMGPPLSDTDWIYGSEPAQIYLSIMHGRPEGMPAWSSMLPRKTVWELVAYIETLDEIDDYAAARGFEPRTSSGGPARDGRNEAQ